MQKQANKLIGRNWYCPHAQERMAERGVAVKNVEEVISHGNRYCTLVKDRQLCVSLEKHLAIILDQKSGTVVTVMPHYDETKLNKFLEKRKKATREDKMNAKEKYERLLRFTAGQKPVTKKDLKFLGTLRID